MSRIIFLENTFEPFLSSWNVWCKPVEYSDQLRSGYYLPLGWEEELQNRSISYSVIEIELSEN